MGNLNWAIVAPGGIATKFATALVQQPDQRLVAVCSRQLSRANDFAKQFSSTAACYDDLAHCLADNSVDVVYVANPHPFHFEVVEAALAAGKAVLCEKPMTMTADQTATLIAMAQDRQLFLMEAIWMRCMPALLDAKRRIAKGDIGDVQFLRAQLTLQRQEDPRHRLFAPELGGGAMLDLGIYPLAFADMMLGVPVSLNGLRRNASTGVDDLFAFNAQYPNGAIAQMLCSTRFEIQNTATIVGTEGSIHVPGFFHQADQYVLTRHGRTPDTVQFPHEVNGYEWEIQAVTRALVAGDIQRPLVLLATSLHLSQQMQGLLSA